MRRQFYIHKILIDILTRARKGKQQMKIKVSQLRRIIRETLEFTNDVRIRAEYDAIYTEKGDVTLEELESALGVVPGAIKPGQLELAGLGLEEDGGILYVVEMN